MSEETIDKTEDEEFFDWIQHGVQRGWISDVVCDTHQGPDMTDEELEEFDEGQDPCIRIVRVWM